MTGSHIYIYIYVYTMFAIGFWNFLSFSNFRGSKTWENSRKLGSMPRAKRKIDSRPLRSHFEGTWLGKTCREVISRPLGLRKVQAITSPLMSNSCGGTCKLWSQAQLEYTKSGGEVCRLRGECRWLIGGPQAAPWRGLEVWQPSQESRPGPPQI